jgi:hypothetical protein
MKLEDMTDKMLEQRITTLKTLITAAFVGIICVLLLLWERAVSEVEYKRLNARLEQLEQAHGYAIDSPAHNTGHNE